MRVKHVSFTYPNYPEQFDGIQKFDAVELAKHVGTNGKKILLVLDYMPQEDLKSGRLLSGHTGIMLSRLFSLANTYYNERSKIDDYSWLAITFNSFRTVRTSDEFKAAATKTFQDRIKHVVCEYKPDMVVTFGLEPFKALGETAIAKSAGKYGNWYGVPINTNCAYKNKQHEFVLIPTLSINTLVNTNSKGDEASLSGYVCRNLINVLHFGLKYSIPSAPAYTPVYIDTVEKFDRMLNIVRKKKRVAIDTETENLNRIKNKVLTVQFAYNVKRAFVVPIYHKDSPFTSKELIHIRDQLREFFEENNENEFHVYTNAVFDLNVMRQNFQIRFYKNKIWDIFAGEFAHDENLKVLQTVTGHHYYSLLNISMQYGSTAYYDAEFGKDKRKTIAYADLDAALIHYCCLDVVLPLYIMEQQIRRSEDSRYKKYISVVSEQISDMLQMFSTLEHNGSHTDIDYLFFLKSKQSPLRQKLDGLVKEIENTKGVRKVNAMLNEKSGCPTVGLFGKSNNSTFSLRRQDHLQMLFFDVLNLKPINDTKKGGGKIDKKFQAKYSDVPEVALFSSIGKLKKLMNSYVNAFIKQWGSDDDMRHDRRIRPYFQFLKVVTGRTSATKPSLHQIPSRGEDGKYIKRIFVAEKGRIQIKIDYNAHEVRCLSLDSFVSTEIGMVKLKDFIEMLDAPLVKSYNHTTGEIEFKKVSNKSVHAPEDDMYEIEYEGGTISVTGNHKIWSKTRNKYVRADCIEEDEELIIGG